MTRATSVERQFLVFRLGAYPLQFLVLLSIFIATVRFRLMGAGFAVLVTAAGALFSPDAFAPYHGVTAMQMVQLFLAVCSLTSVRCAMILNARDVTNAVLAFARQFAHAPSVKKDGNDHRRNRQRHIARQLRIGHQQHDDAAHQ